MSHDDDTVIETERDDRATDAGPEAPQASPPPPDPWNRGMGQFEPPPAWATGYGVAESMVPQASEEGMPEGPYEPDEADIGLEVTWHGGSPELRAELRETLRTVYDPEIPVNVYDLGLIYRVHFDDAGGCQLEMTLTAPGCPVAGPLIEEVEQKLQMIPSVSVVRVVLVFDPPWTLDRMTEAARLQLGMF